MRPNWFVAFPLDGAFLDALPELPPRFRRFHQQDVHLTLAFLGPVGEELATQAFRELEERLHREPVAPIAVSLGEVVPMGRSGAYTALSALLVLGRAETESCILALRDDVLQRAAGRTDRRKPKAHVTLARPERRATPEDRARGLEWAASVDITPVQAHLDRLALYSWHEKRRERLFRVVSEFSLDGSA